MKRISKEEKLAREELTKTQVLNLNDLKEVATYEKNTSKKPAAILAIFGIMLITFGVTYNGDNHSLSQSVNDNNKEIVEKKPLVTMNCQYKELNTVGYDSDINMTLILKNDKLESYSKIMTIKPSLVNPDNNKINNLLNAYMGFNNVNVPGYNIVSNQLSNGFETIVNIDLKNFDRTKLTQYHDANTVTKVEFDYESSQEEVLNKAQEYGYICN